MAAPVEPRFVLADVGGTLARFAFLEKAGRPGDPVEVATGDHESFEAALAAFLDAAGVQPPLAGIAVCAAGPLRDDGSIRLTNCPWIVDPDSVSQSTGTGRPIVVNDFAAIARALPHLEECDRQWLGGGPGQAGALLAVLGPGTGLGVAGLVSDGEGGWCPIDGEGGHVSLTPANAREWQVIEQLIDRFGHASAERAISGPGLANLYAALSAVDGEDAPTPESTEIAARAFAGTDRRAAETVGLFTAWLGSLAGDLALTLGARGGVYVAGGIVHAWGDRFDEKHFRARFEAKGRYREWLAKVPAWRIVHPQPGLLGLARLARNRCS